MSDMPNKCLESFASLIGTLKSCAFLRPSSKRERTKLDSNTMEEPGYLSKRDGKS